MAEAILFTRPRLTRACARPRISAPLVQDLSVIRLTARRVMPGVMPLTFSIVDKIL